MCWESSCQTLGELEPRGKGAVESHMQMSPGQGERSWQVRALHQSPWASACLSDSLQNRNELRRRSGGRLGKPQLKGQAPQAPDSLGASFFPPLTAVADAFPNTCPASNPATLKTLACFPAPAQPHSEPFQLIPVNPIRASHGSSLVAQTEAEPRHSMGQTEGHGE